MVVLISVDEYKQLILEDKAQLARSVTEKLLTYATGAAPTAADKAQIDTIVKWADGGAPKGNDADNLRGLGPGGW